MQRERFHQNTSYLTSWNQTPPLRMTLWYHGDQRNTLERGWMNEWQRSHPSTEPLTLWQRRFKNIMQEITRLISERMERDLGRWNRKCPVTLISGNSLNPIPTIVIWNGSDGFGTLKCSLTPTLNDLVSCKVMKWIWITIKLTTSGIFSTCLDQIILNSNREIIFLVCLFQGKQFFRTLKFCYPSKPKKVLISLLLMCGHLSSYRLILFLCWVSASRKLNLCLQGLFFLCNAIFCEHTPATILFYTNIRVSVLIIYSISLCSFFMSEHTPS